MKRFSFLQVAIALVLMVTAVSCTTMQGTEEEYYQTQSQRAFGADRVYVNDPYRGTVVLERDPYSGRYYEVSSPYTTYNNRYDSRNNRRYGNSRMNNGSIRNNRNYRNNGSYQQTPQQPTQEQIRNNQKNREEARKKVLGN
ncbi:MAG: hypothetical protein ACXWCZ_05305 [Flavisolibacter sp.]